MRPVSTGIDHDETAEVARLYRLTGPSSDNQGASRHSAKEIMVDAELLESTLRAMGPRAKPEARRTAERQLEGLVLELLDAKVRRGLGCRSQLQALTAVANVAMGPSAGLTAAARVVLNRFCYRLAHVAMRSREWELALELLDAVLAGEGDLTRAQLYRTLCLAKLKGSLSSRDIEDLLESHRQEAAQPATAPALDVLVQDPTTNLLELFLLAQDAPEECLDRLYDPAGRHRTTGLTLVLHPEGGSGRTLTMSEWLAEAHLQEYRRERWLVVDATVESAGEQGKGSGVNVPGGNMKSEIALGILQVLGVAAPTPLTQDVVKTRFMEWDGAGLLDKIDDQDTQEENKHKVTGWKKIAYRASSVELADFPGHKVILRSEATGLPCWQLKPPYVVVLRDDATVLRQAAGSSQ